MRIALLVLLLGMSVDSVNGQVSVQPGLQEVLQLREDAERAYNAQDAETAIALFLELTGIFPQDPEAWYGLSRGYEWAGDLDNAIATAEKSLEFNWYGRAYFSYRLAQLNAVAGNADHAIDWIAAALHARYEDRPEIQTDEAFVNIRSEPRFHELAATIPADLDGRTELLRFDLRYLVEEAQRLHVGPERPAFSAEFEGQASQLHDNIPGLSDDEFVFEVMRLLAVLRDGHSGLYGAGPDSPLQVGRKTLPVKFYWFAEGVYIVDGFGDFVKHAGSKVLRIGDMSPEKVLTEMSAYRGLDNQMMWKWMGPQFYLGNLPLLNVVGATESFDHAELTLENSDGQVERHRIDGGEQRPQRKLRHSPASDAPVPMYLEQVDVAHWINSLPQHGAIYAQFNQVRDSEDQSINAFARDLADRLVSEKAKNLIIDVRHNNGGNNTLLGPLIRAIVGFEQAADENTVYVITGRNTFSAAQNFINRIERWTDATFVGEPSSSSPNFVGEETNLLLPYSRLRGSISSRYWQDSDPGDQRDWITPTVPVQPTAADYFAGRDAALEATIAIIRSRSER